MPTDDDACGVLDAAFANPRLWYVPVAAQLPAGDAHELIERVLARVHGTAPAGGPM